MMEIRIAGYVAASYLLDREPKQWHTLAVLDSGIIPSDFIASHSRSYRYLHFDDVEAPRGNKLPPTRLAIEQGLDFAKDKDRLLVTCRAGQGRSVGLAYTISCREFGTADAVKILNPTRHRPNRLVVELGASLLELPEALSQFDHWRRSNAHIQLSDHYDEMEKEFEALAAKGAVNRICR